MMITCSYHCSFFISISFRFSHSFFVSRVITIFSICSLKKESNFYQTEGSCGGGWSWSNRSDISVHSVVCLNLHMKFKFHMWRCWLMRIFSLFYSFLNFFHQIFISSFLFVSALSLEGSKAIESENGMLIIKNWVNHKRMKNFFRVRFPRKVRLKTPLMTRKCLVVVAKCDINDKWQFSFWWCSNCQGYFLNWIF